MSKRSMQNVKELLGLLGLFACLMLLATVVGCPMPGGLGVCTGYSTIFNKTYCGDGWTASECAEWDAEGVNGASWYFHAGQTCEERGTPENL